VPKSNRSSRGLLNVTLNGLTSAGVIAGFQSNYATKNEPDRVRITVTALDAADITSIQRTVVEALVEAGIDAEVVVVSAGVTD
jgi:hypothetical protein